MDTEELIKKCSSITLEEEEEDKVIYEGMIKEKGDMLATHCLIGKILLNRGIHIEGLRIAMRQVWKTLREVKIESMGENFFMFKFGSEEDKKRVFAGGPWHFDNALIVFTEPTGVGDIKKQSFSHTSFWIQFHNVPLMCMDKYAVQKLGSLIGKVEDVDTDEVGECVGPIVRTRISVDVTRPLKKIMFLQQEDRVKTPIGVQYERLPKFCFCCGLVGHQYRECLKYKGQQKEKLAYGSWLKALPVTEWNRKNRRRGKWNKEHHQQNLEMVNTASQNQNQTRQTQSNPKKDNGSGQSESDNRLYDIGEAKLSNTAGKCSPRKLECRAGTSGRQESERQNEIKRGVVPNPQDISSQNISEVEELLAWEQHNVMALEDIETIPEDIAAGAGEQPRRQQ
ncbi:zinc knuckle protein [Citrus sinensis]|uniref:Zinc knuckle protein n=1 Tax=Citrus sinensis TaxID=2711 RepID=A0ACB8MCC8_CITSI|nr:zinc knuckle protein [Citrus sinensis]